jgi:hypothetical protein
LPRECAFRDIRGDDIGGTFETYEAPRHQVELVADHRPAVCDGTVHHTDVAADTIDAPLMR